MNRRELTLLIIGYFVGAGIGIYLSNLHMEQNQISRTLLIPDVKIVTINGISDTTYIYHFK
jgi:hypothetical protein